MTPAQLVLLLLAVMTAGLPGAWLLGQGHFWFGIASGQVLGGCLPIGAVAWAYRASWRTWFPFHSISWTTIGWIILAGIGLATAMETLILWLQAHWQFPLLFEQRYAAEIRASGVLPGTLRVLLLCIAPALTEEMLFRGIVFGALRARGPRLALCISALCFGLAHWSLWYLPLYAALGLYLGWLRARGRNLWWPILAHAVNNGWTLWLMQ